MPCGCTDRLKTGNKLDMITNNKVLKLDDMKYMSIDDIVNLYRNGHIIENVNVNARIDYIKALASVEVKMITATGYVYAPGSETRLMALVTNSTIEGETKWVGYIDTGTCTSPSADNIWTLSVTRHGLKDLMWVDMSGVFNFGCLKTWGCTSGAMPCSSWDASAGNTLTGIQVLAYNTTNPGSIPNFNVTAQDGSIRLTWDAVPDPSGISEVFAYKIDVWRGTTRDISTFTAGGYAQDGQRDVVISDLTNGQLYTVDIKALSYNQRLGAQTSRTVTPTAPLTGAIHFVVKDSGNNPLSGVTVNVDGNNRGTTNPSGVLDVTGLTASITGTSHSYALSKTGYTTIIDSALVYPGQITNVTRNMATATSQCLVISTPTAVPSTATIGDNVVLSADITPPDQSFSVDFKEGGTILGTVPATGTATFNWNTTGKTAGPHDIFAYIGGTSPCESSTVRVTLNNPTGTVGAVRFHVNCGGVPCENAHILLLGVEKGLTGLDGTVVVQNIPVGPRTFTIRKSGYSDGSVSVIVAQDITVDANLVTLALVSGGGGGLGILLGIVGIAAVGMMMSAPKPKPPIERPK